jgi:hypothetical protein
VTTHSISPRAYRRAGLCHNLSYQYANLHLEFGVVLRRPYLAAPFVSLYSATCRSQYALFVHQTREAVVLQFNGPAGVFSDIDLLVSNADKAFQVSLSVLIHRYFTPSLATHICIQPIKGIGYILILTINASLKEFYISGRGGAKKVNALNSKASF